MSSVACAACHHEIDSAARACPYCGADPRTGEKLDTQAILQEVFQPREVSTSESVIEFARQRQGIVVAVTIVIGFLILAGLHQFVTMRNDSDVSAAPAVPLTEVTDVTDDAAATKAQPMPELDFQYEGRPQAMRTFVIEQGAATPPEIVAAQQAAAAEAAAKAKAQAASPQPAPAMPPRR